MKGTYWAGKMQAGEVAMFHFDGKTRMLCSAEGGFDSAPVTVFPSLEAAEQYAQNYVHANPRRGCRLYNVEGDCISEIRGSAVPFRRYTKANAKRDVYLGIAGFILVPVGFFLDKWIGWSLFLGMALGTKFVLLGILKTSDGIAGLLEHRHKE